jgi:hypothetical protein
MTLYVILRRISQVNNRGRGEPLLLFFFIYIVKNLTSKDNYFLLNDISFITKNKRDIKILFVLECDNLGA